MSECARKGLANKPVKGDALMFYSLTPDGKEDPLSLHGSCPTTKGCGWHGRLRVRVCIGWGGRALSRHGSCPATEARVRPPPPSPRRAQGKVERDKVVRARGALEAPTHSAAQSCRSPDAP